MHGLRLTWRHFLEARESRKPVGVADESYFDQKTGIVTLQYPKQQLPVPEKARYQLHNEIDDCIVCDKCAKVCPVDCIDIEPIKSPEVFGTTSDGTAKRLYAAKFDIDMAKCCFCGLCTTVCPTECLTMTKEFDFSVFDVDQHTFEYANLSITEIAQKRKEWDEHQAKKAMAKPASAATTQAKPGVARPNVAQPGVARPVAKPATDPQEMARQLMEKKKQAKEGEQSEAIPSGGVKPVFRPKIKPKTTIVAVNNDAEMETEQAKPAKPVFRPKIKPNISKTESVEEESASAKSSENKPAKLVFRPKIKPTKAEEASPNKEEGLPAEKNQAKPIYRPKIKPLMKKASDTTSDNDKAEQEPLPKPVIKPKVVIRKPDQEDKTEKEKQQEENLRPGDGGPERE